LWCRQKPLLEAVKVKTPMTATKLMKTRMNVPPRVLGKRSFAKQARADVATAVQGRKEKPTPVPRAGRGIALV
jgi:hypothetical protein